MRPHLSIPGTLAFTALTFAVSLRGDPVPVRHLEGAFRGFLLLRDLNGAVLATGDSSQLAASESRITNETVFHFRDGSLHQETYIFSEHHMLQLLSYHLIQKGPSFPRPTDMTLDTSTGRVSISYTEDGKVKTISDQMKLPSDIANGLISTIMNHVDPKAMKTTVSMLASTPKPRLVRLEISPAGEEPFSIAGSARKATRFVVHVDIGGIAGVIAPFIGKQPPDTNIWLIEGSAPGFLKAEGPLYEGGPVWRIELANPVWPKNEPGRKP